MTGDRHPEWHTTRPTDKIFAKRRATIRERIANAEAGKPVVIPARVERMAIA